MDNGVSFNEESQYVPNQYGPSPSNAPGILGIVIKLGLAKNEKEATTILLVLTGICAAIIIYFVYTGLVKPVPKLKFVEGQSVFSNPTQ